MSALNRFHETTSDALEKISACLPSGAKICLAIYTLEKPELDIVLQDKGLDLNEMVSTLRRRGLSIDGDNAYKRDLCDAIDGAMAFGAQERNPPPEGHWAQHFWEIGREKAEHKTQLLQALETVTDCLSEALTGGEVSAAVADNALTNAGALIELHRT